MSMNDYLYRLATEGRLSRREFMSRAAALGVSTALATSMADKAFAQTPKQGAASASPSATAPPPTRSTPPTGLTTTLAWRPAAPCPTA